MKEKLLMLVLISFIISCEMEKEIEYDYVFDNESIVVHGFITVNGVEAVVRKTVSPLKDYGSSYLENANVLLIENYNKQIKLIEKDSGFFATPDSFVPEVNYPYILKVEANGFKTVTSSPQSIPDTVKIDSVQFIKASTSSKIFNIIINITKGDNDHENGYYYKYFRFQNGQNFDIENYNEIFNPYGLISYNEMELSDNRIILENIYLKEFNASNYFDSIKIEIFNLSEDLQKFLSSIIDYESTKDDPWYGQPLPVYSNIVNGYGIFSSYSLNVKTIKIDTLELFQDEK